ncbi:hypothetical protein [Sutcliffiella horikoshii]|uniref:hypothetical protein n=1 Tax=Sutcliffiella horikoshii TaxID=79883 RepID=UPI001F321421|nr:hypothetical protein [Sutcliffiella horikoshii]MCG1020314.1 hypothetical protein [Sutcliffiella horikoshii]
MKIRVKIKHLVLSGVAVVLFLPFFYLIQPQYSIFMAERQMAKGEVAGKEKVVELIESGHIFSEQRFALIRDYMIEGVYSLDYDVYVGTTSTYWSDANQSKVKFTKQERMPYLLEYVEHGPTDGYMEEAAKELALYYHQIGEWETGDKVLQTALDRADSYFRSQLATEQIDLAVQNKQFEAAQAYIDAFYEKVNKEDYQMITKVAKSQVEVLLHLGKKEDALALAEKTIFDSNSRVMEGKDEYADLPLAEKQFQSLLNRLKNGEGSFGNVTGKIYKQDKENVPMEGVGVFLREKNNLYYSIGSEEQIQTVTDESGEYVFENVPSGSYQLFYGFTYDQIDGYTLSMPANPWVEVKGSDVVAHDSVIQPLMEIYTPVNSEEITEDDILFSWDPVDGAAYYSISVGRELEGGGSVSHHLKSGIRSTEISITKEELHYSQGVILFTEESDWEDLNYTSVLGFADPRGRFFWNVQAYNGNGDLITQSQGYRLGEETFGNLPMFYLKNRELTEADNMLLKNKPKKALEMYKESFANNPDDLHSLLMICKIIGVEAEVLNTSSQELAIPYLEELASKSPSEFVLVDILQYYDEKGDWQSYDKWYARFEEIKGSILNEHIEGKHALALMKRGKVEEARAKLQEVMEYGHRHEFIGEWIALELNMGTPLEMVGELARQYPEQGIYEVRIDWESLVKNLQRENEQYDGYEEELKVVMGWAVKGETTELEAWRTSTEKVELKRFVDEMRK